LSREAAKCGNHVAESVPRRVHANPEEAVDHCPAQLEHRRAERRMKPGFRGRPGRLRIVGGRHGGRLLPIPRQPGLRPTPERARETLFNWLAPVIEGARCLDLYAGSGALGLEAVSRGAAHVTLVERNQAVVRVLRGHVQLLGEERVTVVRADALRWLRSGSGPGPFDIVFLDPPFQAGLLVPSCRLLAAHGWLAPRARVYLEAPASAGLPELPARWRRVREGRAGQVCFALSETGHELM
jgi:16S rRNA (guanine966-N2)-methyltransferase